MDKYFLVNLCVMIAFILIIFFLVSCFKWYKASVQVGVYKRQGIEMTQWEVFWGAEPAEKVMQIKPEK